MFGRCQGALLPFVLGFATLLPAAVHAQDVHVPGAMVLTREDAAKILPATVFYRGQTAPVQARNSAGLRVPGGKLVLFALVDNSGYATGIAERYQGTLITEVPLHLGQRTLPPGEYGFGFLPGRMVVMDLGANPVLETPTTRDDGIKRPNPLQIVESGAQDRLYLGRDYIVVSPQP